MTDADVQQLERPHVIPEQKKPASKIRKTGPPPLDPHAEWGSDLQLCRKYQCSRAQWWRWAKEGRIPAPKKFGPRMTRFNVAACAKALEG